MNAARLPCSRFTARTSSTTGPHVRDVHSFGELIVNTTGVPDPRTRSSRTWCIEHAGERVHRVFTPRSAPTVGVATGVARTPGSGVAPFAVTLTVVVP